MLNFISICPICLKTMEHMVGRYIEKKLIAGPLNLRNEILTISRCNYLYGHFDF